MYFDIHCFVALSTVTALVLQLRDRVVGMKSIVSVLTILCVYEESRVSNYELMRHICKSPAIAYPYLLR